MEYVSNVLLWTFALFGLFEFMKMFFCQFLSTKESEYVFILVKNGEEYIEGFLRSEIFKVLYGKENFIKKILVVDLSTDNKTMEIIEKMKSNYEFVNVVNIKDINNQKV